MAGASFVGRPRRRWKILLFGILTFGVYGRVWLYRTAREIDGHHVFFLDLRLYLLGVILPLIGPLVIKWRLVELLDGLNHHDVTAPPLSKATFRWVALVPWFPVFALLFQPHLAHHWALHQKLDDVAAMREVVEERRKKARSKAAQEEVAQLEADLRDRETSLQLAQEAAVAIREAEASWARSERDLRLLEKSRRRPLLSRLKLWRRAAPPPEAQSHPEAAAPKPRRFRFGRARSLDAAATESGATAAVEAAAEPAPPKRSWFRLGRRKEAETPIAESSEPPSGTIEEEPPQAKRRRGKSSRRADAHS